MGTPVDSLAEAQPGDLVFFEPGAERPGPRRDLHRQRPDDRRPPHRHRRPGPGGGRADPPSAASSPTPRRRHRTRRRRARCRAPSRPASACPPTWRRCSSRRRPHSGVPASLLAAVAKQESGYDPSAVSSAGAAGPHAAHAVDRGRPRGQRPRPGPGHRRRPPSSSASYLQQYNGSVPLALAAYNAGPGAVAQYGGVPPYARDHHLREQHPRHARSDVMSPDRRRPPDAAPVRRAAHAGRSRARRRPSADGDFGHAMSAVVSATIPAPSRRPADPVPQTPDDARARRPRTPPRAGRDPASAAARDHRHVRHAPGTASTPARDPPRRRRRRRIGHAATDGDAPARRRRRPRARRAPPRSPTTGRRVRHGRPGPVSARRPDAGARARHRADRDRAAAHDRDSPTAPPARHVDAPGPRTGGSRCRAHRRLRAQCPARVDRRRDADAGAPSSAARRRPRRRTPAPGRVSRRRESRRPDAPPTRRPRAGGAGRVDRAVIGLHRSSTAPPPPTPPRTGRRATRRLSAGVTGDRAGRRALDAAPGPVAAPAAAAPRRGRSRSPTPPAPPSTAGGPGAPSGRRRRPRRRSRSSPSSPPCGRRRTAPTRSPSASSPTASARQGHRHRERRAGRRPAGSRQRPGARRAAPGAARCCATSSGGDGSSATVLMSPTDAAPRTRRARPPTAPSGDAAPPTRTTTTRPPPLAAAATRRAGPHRPAPVSTSPYEHRRKPMTMIPSTPGSAGSSAPPTPARHARRVAASTSWTTPRRSCNCSWPS